jgi:histidine phosphotransferase ChpT
MNEMVEMRVLELLSARLCHELIGPVAAIGNGAELLAEDDPEFARDAAALVGGSARQAAVRLQFYRFAYGFGPGGTLTGPPPHDLVGGFLQAMRIDVEYHDSVRALPLDWQKLACNLVALGADALPRGGRLVVAAGPEELHIDGSGEGGGLTAQARAALLLDTPVAELTSRTVQPYFAGLLARSLGRRLGDAPSRKGGFRVLAMPG